MTVEAAWKDDGGHCERSVAKQKCFTQIPAESACSTSSDSDEECLRPSLLKRRRQLGEKCKPCYIHPGNLPTIHQTPIGAHRTVSHSDLPELQQQGVSASDHYCSPVRQTPFAPLSPNCPSSGAPSRSCFTPTAEHDLFGSPATSVPPECTPACRSSMFDSPGLQKQMRHGEGPSKALAHISRLQRERTHLVQQIKGHEQQQQQAELLMQDADFLHSRLQALKSSSKAAEQAASQTRGAETEASLQSQPAKAETLELWQQLSSESSNSNEAHQLEELQAQLCHTTKQLRTKEEEVVGLTIQLVSVHTQLDDHQIQHAKSAQQHEAVHSELAQSAQRLQATKLQLASSAQQLESTQQRMEELTSAAALAESSLQQQQKASQQHTDSLARLLEQGRVTQTSFSSQLREAQAQAADLTRQLSEQSVLRQSAILAQSSLTEQLEQSQQQRKLLADQLEQSQASCSDFSAQLRSATQQLDQLSDAHVMDESTILDQLSETQDEVQRLTCELAESQEQQAVLSEQLEQVRCEHEEAAEAHTVTEATLLDQLNDTQAELEQSSIQVRHFEQRHQEMCQQLTFARVGQAEAMQAANKSKEQLSRQLQSMQADHQTAANELLSTQASLSAAHHQLQEEERKHAAANRDLSQSGMQSFELSQRLQESQMQLSQQLDMSGKLQAKLKKSRSSQLSLHKKLELTKAETLSTSERQAEAVRAQLGHMRSQLDAAQAEVAQASDLQVQPEGQLHKAQADKQAHAQVDLLNSQVAQLARQLAHSHDREAQLTQQLQAVTTSLEVSQTDSSQAVSECLELRCRLKDVSAQLEQSCSRQAEYAVEQQRGASELQAARAESDRLADALAQAECAKQAVDAQLKNVHNQHRKLRAKAEQLAVRCARYDSLQADLAEAQTQLAAHCAHVQVERQRSERVTQRLVVAGNMLSKALYNLQFASPQLPRQGGVGTELGSTAEQVCSLVEALLTHQLSTQPLAQATDPQPSGASSRPVDALRSHVAQAQARANHIVNEFESMLLVTGGHSMKEVVHIQSQAGLAEDAATASALPLAGLSRTNRRTSPALKRTARQSRDSSTSTVPPSLGTSNSSGVTRSGKSSVTSSKENRAPALTYVTGGQIRGAKTAHARQPLKPSVADNTPGLSSVDVLTHKARTTGVHKSKR
ncbi:hypothetical protein WJX77_002077 [Trebouxia sp. C0004]